MMEITQSQWRSKLAFVGKQIAQIMPTKTPHVICGCHKVLKLYHAYKCLYCHEWYCKSCAEIHFGKTVEQHRKENPIVEDPKPLCGGYLCFPDGSKCEGCEDCDEKT